MGSTRIKGAQLSLELAGTEHMADIIKAELDNEAADGDVTTFEDAAAGGKRQFFFNLTALQSTATGSFWSYLWDNPGEDVAYVYAPHGNAVPSAAQPHFTGTVKIGAKPKLGGEAGSGNTYTFETRLDCNEDPTKVIA